MLDPDFHVNQLAFAQRKPHPNPKLESYENWNGDRDVHRHADREPHFQFQRHPDSYPILVTDFNGDGNLLCYRERNVKFQSYTLSHLD